MRKTRKVILLFNLGKYLIEGNFDAADFCSFSRERISFREQPRYTELLCQGSQSLTDMH